MKYSAAFLLSKDSKRSLTSDGWVFQTWERLPDEIIDQLKDALGVRFREVYSGIEVYSGDDVKMSVNYDESGEIEFVSFQIYGDNLERFKRKINHCEYIKSLELFFP